MSYEYLRPEDGGISQSKRFDNWTNDPENFEKAKNNQEISLFEMFDYSQETYKEDIEKFAQEYIDLYDKDGNKTWDKNEFIKMSTGVDDESELDADMAELMTSLYNTLDIDDKKGEISADEFASMLYAIDFGDGTGSSADGKLDYASYMALSGLTPSDELYDSVEKVRKKYLNINDDSAKYVMKQDDRILTDENGNLYVKVQPWNNNYGDNNCLERIIAHSYDLKAMGIQPYSKEYLELEKAVMDANPEIYGTEDGGWRKEIGGPGRHNACIKTGERIILPNGGAVKEEKAQIPETGMFTQKEETAYGTLETTYADGKIVSELTKNHNGDVTSYTTYKESKDQGDIRYQSISEYNDQGKRTSENTVQYNDDGSSRNVNDVYIYDTDGKLVEKHSIETLTNSNGEVQTNYSVSKPIDGSEFAFTKYNADANWNIISSLPPEVQEPKPYDVWLNDITESIDPNNRSKLNNVLTGVVKDSELSWNEKFDLIKYAKGQDKAGTSQFINNNNNLFMDGLSALLKDLTVKSDDIREFLKNYYEIQDTNYLSQEKESDLLRVIIDAYNTSGRDAFDIEEATTYSKDTAIELLQQYHPEEFMQTQGPAPEPIEVPVEETENETEYSYSDAAKSVLADMQSRAFVLDRNYLMQNVIQNQDISMVEKFHLFKEAYNGHDINFTTTSGLDIPDFYAGALSVMAKSDEYTLEDIVEVKQIYHELGLKVPAKAVKKAAGEVWKKYYFDVYDYNKDPNLPQTPEAQAMRDYLNNNFYSYAYLSGQSQEYTIKTTSSAPTSVPSTVQTPPPSSAQTPAPTPAPSSTSGLEQPPEPEIILEAPPQPENVLESTTPAPSPTPTPPPAQTSSSAQTSAPTPAPIAAQTSDLEQPSQPENVLEPPPPVDDTLLQDNPDEYLYEDDEEEYTYSSEAKSVLADMQSKGFVLDRKYLYENVMLNDNITSIVDKFHLLLEEYNANDINFTTTSGLDLRPVCEAYLREIQKRSEYSQEDIDDVTNIFNMLFS